MRHSPLIIYPMVIGALALLLGGILFSNNVSAYQQVYIDEDGDNMDDSWEIQYFGNLSQPAFGDYDGDGSHNHEEFLFDTDPTDPESNPDSKNTEEDGWFSDILNKILGLPGDLWDFFVTKLVSIGFWIQELWFGFLAGIKGIVEGIFPGATQEDYPAGMMSQMELANDLIFSIGILLILFTIVRMWIFVQDLVPVW